MIDDLPLPTDPDADEETFRVYYQRTDESKMRGSTPAVGRTAADAAARVHAVADGDVLVCATEPLVRGEIDHPLIGDAE